MLPPGVLALSLRGPVTGTADQVHAALASTGATDPVLHE